MTGHSLPSAPLHRRYFAMFYDGLLLVAILLIASSIPLIFTGGEAIKGHNLLLTGYFLLVCFSFFGWFWTHGGQTLGMRVWRLKVVHEHTGSLDWLAALLRFASGVPGWLVLILGLTVYYNPALHLPGVLRWLQNLPDGSIIFIGIVWLSADNWPEGWRERVTHTRVVLLPKS